MKLIKVVNSRSPSFHVVAALLAMGTLFATPTLGYERYKNPSTGSGNCASCHGNFTGSTSPKGTVFPSGNKHTMHRSSSYMDTDCDLCHRSNDSNNPYIGLSDGIPGEVEGLGCTGCHNGVGLRAHHEANGIASCRGCHPGDANLTAPPENESPPYYGTAYTKANNPCNDAAVSDQNENWSEGDFLGLDNDGNNVYDALDPACTPYRIVRVEVEGNNVRVTWDTAGGRTDVLQASDRVESGYTNVSAPLLIAGSGVVTTNYVESGAATNATRFYRLRLIP